MNRSGRRSPGNLLSQSVYVGIPKRSKGHPSAVYLLVLPLSYTEYSVLATALMMNRRLARHS